MKYEELDKTYTKTTSSLFWQHKLKRMAKRYDDSFKISYNKLGNEVYWIENVLYKTITPPY